MAADAVKTPVAVKSASKATDTFKIPLMAMRDLFRRGKLSSCIPVDFHQGAANHFRQATRLDAGRVEQRAAHRFGGTSCTSPKSNRQVRDAIGDSWNSSLRFLR